MSGVVVPEIENFQEARTMLAERVKEWTQQWHDEGRQEGEAAVLCRLIERKFGHLDEESERRITAADSDQLLGWCDQVLAATNIEEIFNWTLVSFETPPSHEFDFSKLAD
jgi:hypothetical protein